MKEIWKPIHGYETRYLLSNKGNIKSLYSNKILKPIDSHGYKYVHLCNINHQRQNKAIHRLVAENFINNPMNYNEVNHLDGNKSNNYITNLEWCSKSDNINHMVYILNKGNKRKVKCVEDNKTFNSIKEASIYYNKPASNLCAVLNHYKYYKTFANKHWKYVV